MTDKQQQIEEMAKVLCGITNACKDCKINGNCFAYNSAEALYNARYRKVGENAVVMRGGELAGQLGIEWSKGYAQARKETAKEILDKVSRHYGGVWLVELYKEYGVEVE